MRKLVLGMAMSLDGYVCGPNGEQDWMIHDNEVDDDVLPDLLHTTDTILLGRDTYEGFTGYWPNAIAWNPTMSEGQKQFAKWIIDVPKVVFSTTLDKADWNNTRLIKENAAEEVAKMKQQPGKAIGLAGGVRLAQSMLGYGLVDEISLRIIPVAIGRGLSIFSTLESQLDLKLVHSKIYAAGTALLHYEVKHR